MGLKETRFLQVLSELSAEERNTEFESTGKMRSASSTAMWLTC